VVPGFQNVGVSVLTTATVWKALTVLFNIIIIEQILRKRNVLHI
jgi:hypothetical protein